MASAGSAESDVKLSVESTDHIVTTAPQGPHRCMTFLQHLFSIPGHRPTSHPGLSTNDSTRASPRRQGKPLALARPPKRSDRANIRTQAPPAQCAARGTLLSPADAAIHASLTSLSNHIPGLNRIQVGQKAKLWSVLVHGSARGNGWPQTPPVGAYRTKKAAPVERPKPVGWVNRHTKNRDPYP